MSENNSDVDLPETSPLSSQLTQVNDLHELFNCRQYEHCKSGENVQQMIEILKQNLKIHHQLLDCMICIQNEEITELIKNKYSQKQAIGLPYKCFKLFESLNEEYAKYLFEHENKTEKEKQETDSILKHYFMVFQDQEINQTAAGYVLKINEMVLMRESSSPLFDWLNDHEQILENILKNFGSCSAVGIINRVLDLDPQVVSAQIRLTTIKRIFEKIAQLVSKHNNPDLVNGLKLFVDDQLQRAMSVDDAQILSDQIANPENLRKLQPLSLINQQSVNYIYEIFSSIINHYKKQQVKLQNSNSRNFMGYRSLPELKINPNVIEEIIQILKNTEKLTLQQERSNQSGFVNTQRLSYLEILSLIALHNTEYISKIVSDSNINQLLIEMQKYPQNNILHNYSKNIIVGFLKTVNKQQNLYKNKDLKLVDFVFKHFLIKDCYYKQHLFLILKELQEDQSFIEESKHLTDVDTTLVFQHYKKLLQLEAKLQTDDEKESNTDSIIDNQLINFDPTANIDDLSPYYYQPMAIDDPCQEKTEPVGGSYNDWIKGIMKGGIISKDINIDISEQIVQSPVINSEIDSERIWGFKQCNSLLDSQNEEAVYQRKLSSKKQKQRQQQQLKNDILNDQKQQYIMQLNNSKQSQNNILSSQVKDSQNSYLQLQITSKQSSNNNSNIIQPLFKSNKQPSQLQPISQSSKSIKKSNKAIWLIGIVLSPFIYIGNYLWDMAD